ncbi:bacillithiol system redox-active protein YtxJ [Flavobacteriaceae bacterium]|nr:bacillithiol system redox-active protein YtxJ [Flavobacteriaceae bacterium]
MGIFNSLFKSEEKDSNWPGEQLQSADQLEVIATASFATPQLIFKHSTRCSISRFILSDFMNHFTYSSEEFGAHYLDLLNHRDVSNAIAERFHVVHQSPQLIIIKDGKAVADASHEGINALQLSKFL